MKNQVWAIVAALVVGLAAQVGMTAASPGMSDASKSGAPQGNIRVHLRGYIEGPQFAAFGRGRFTMSGAISDHGRFVDEFQGVHPPDEPHIRTLRGAKGTIHIKVDGAFGSPKWRITSGTKAYAGLRGRGRESGLYFSKSTIDITMSGTVSQ